MIKLCLNQQEDIYIYIYISVVGIDIRLSTPSQPEEDGRLGRKKQKEGG